MHTGWSNLKFFFKKFMEELVNAPSQENTFIDSIMEYPAIGSMVESTFISWDISSTVLESYVNRSNAVLSDGVEVGQGDSILGSSGSKIQPTYLLSEAYVLGTSVGKQSSWKLMINPSHIENGTRYISMHLWMCQLDPPNEHVDVVYKFHVLSKLNNKTLLSNRKEFESGLRRFSESSPSFGWNKFISYAELGSKLSDVIRFKARVTIHSDPGTIPTETSPEPSDRVEQIVEFMEIDNEDECFDNATIAELTKAQRIRNYVAELWLTKDSSDTKVIVKGFEILVHSDVLKARSPIFKEHFSSGCKTPYLIEDYDVEVVEGVIEYCYTGMITKVFSYENKVQVFSVAKFLKMDSLKEFAIDMIVSEINASNFTLIYEFMKAEKSDTVGNYSMEEFLRFLHEFCKKRPHILASYKQNISTFASIIL